MFRCVLFFVGTISFSCWAQEVSVEKVNLEIGVLTDVATYVIRGASFEEVKMAVKLVRVRESAASAINKVHEFDFTPEHSLAMVRPLSVPTGLVVKWSNHYYGGGAFGPVWGHFEVERGDGFWVVKDYVSGSPIFRYGHHKFAPGVPALTSALKRVRDNPNLCEAVF